MMFMKTFLTLFCFLFPGPAALADKPRELNKRLIQAVKEGRLTTAESLLKEGANVNARGSLGWTPIYWAALKNNMEMAELLIEYGATVQVKTIFGLTPLHRAAGHGNKAMVELFLKHKALINAKDKYLRTALDWAENKNRNIKKKHKQTDLDLEKERKRKEAADYLIQKGGKNGVNHLVIWLAVTGAGLGAWGYIGYGCISSFL